MPLSCQKLLWPCKGCTTIDAVDFSPPSLQTDSYHLACFRETIQQTQPLEDNVLRLQLSAHVAVSLSPEGGWCSAVSADKCQLQGQGRTALHSHLTCWLSGSLAKQQKESHGLCWMYFIAANLFPSLSRPAASFFSLPPCLQENVVPLRHKHQASQERWYFLLVLLWLKISMQLFQGGELLVLPLKLLLFSLDYIIFLLWDTVRNCR